MKACGLCFLIAALIFGCVGMYKGYTYDSREYINTYVGGDAYNYIINTNFFIGYMVLAAGFTLASVICIATGEILEHLELIGGDTYLIKDYYKKKEK